MNTSEKNKCKRCGTEIPSNSTENLCPACLLSGVLKHTGDKGETFSASTGQSHLPQMSSEFPIELGGYKLLGFLGRGGMGTVYEAELLADGRRVALKILEQKLDLPELRQRFLREGRIAASVNHPNSLYIFGSEEIEGLPVITMEIAGRGTLKDKLKKQGSLPTTEAVDAILDVIAGLDAAYKTGVLHRDIKPSNCFVSPDGSVKIGDFGLSVSTLTKFDSYITETGAIMGTPAYASPEQLRGDNLDVRADIYSVGATLYTLLTNRAPFEGDNPVVVVSNAISKKPKPMAELKTDVPPGLERVVSRCLSKDPQGRYPDYSTLRNALLPYSSKEPEPASMKVRAQAGWIDYLIGFLIPYVILMLAIGNETFHLGFIMERTLYSARHYLAFLCFGFLYFSFAEGFWGGGFGKRLKGLFVVRKNGQKPGLGRAFLRIFIPILSVEGVRIPFLLLAISATQINDLTTLEIVFYSGATTICPLFPILLMLNARPRNAYATLWDRISGTRVVVKPKAEERPPIDLALKAEVPLERGDSIGPYRIIKEIVPGQWILADDPVLRRRIWLFEQSSFDLSLNRQNLARPARLRWLQKVEKDKTTWNAFEAIQGVPFLSLVEGGKRIPWRNLRHLLHDLASELWASSGDKTLPDKLSLNNIFVTSQGHAVLLDKSWPSVKIPTPSLSVDNLEGQQRFLSMVAEHAEKTSLPLHARPVLKNLEKAKFEKLSFLTGTLRGHLDKPVEVSRGIRTGSIFMLPFYVWIMIFVGTQRGAEWIYAVIGDSTIWIAMAAALVVLVVSALVQILEIPFKTTFGYSIFRLAVVNNKGDVAGISILLIRWAVVWLPLLLPLSILILLSKRGEASVPFVVAIVWILIWIGTALSTAIHPHRGLHDRIAGTWVVRR